MKRIISMFLALVLVIFSLLPALAPQAHAEEVTETTESTAPEASVVADDTSTSGSGFLIDTENNTKANEYWRNVDIYSLFNSSENGFLLTSINDSYCGLALYTDSDFLFIRGAAISSLYPYTSLTYPFGSLVEGLEYVTNQYSHYDSFSCFRNYQEAYNYWANSGKFTRYLTEDSYISFDLVSTLTNKYVCTINNLGFIAADGTVSFGSSFSFKFDSSKYSTPTGLYSDTASIPGGTSTIPTVTPGGDAQDYGWNYYEQGSAGPTLSVTAESPNNGTLSYSWQVYDFETQTSSVISGATSNSYTVPTDTVGTFLYTCSVLNTYPTGSSVNAVQWSINIYSESQGAGEGITWQILDDGTLLISGNGPMANYTSFTSVPWYSYKDSITSVVVTDGITHLGNYSFRGLSNVASVSLPDSLITIGNSVFYSCHSLSSLLIPEGVVSVGHNLVGSNNGIKIVVLPSTLTMIDYFSFAYATYLSVIYCYSIVPPSNPSPNSLFASNKYLSVIYVPYGSGEAYRNHEDWSEVADKIVEMEPDADPIDTIEELSVVVNKILAELEEMNTTQTGLLGSILDAINSWGQAIVDAIGGGFTTEQTPDEFEEKLDSTLTELGAAGDAIASVQRPDHSTIDFNVGAMIPQNGVAALASCFNDMMAFEGLQTLIITFVTMSLAAFVIFGRG